MSAADMTIDQRLAYCRWMAAAHRKRATNSRTPKANREKHLEQAQAFDIEADNILGIIDRNKRTLTGDEPIASLGDEVLRHAGQQLKHNRTP